MEMKVVLGKGAARVVMEVAVGERKRKKQGVAGGGRRRRGGDWVKD